VRVREATASKSYVFIRASREGLADGGGAREGGGLAQSEDGEMVDVSRVPRCLEDGREVLINDGAWISE
jgi:hypothetical protein